MSSTRHVEQGERRKQNGWASASEFEVLRHIDGTAAAAKAALVDHPAKRELLYFLQGLSLREGGVKRIASEIVEMFPERIGTPTMLKIGCRPGKRLTQEQRDTIHEELHGPAFDARDLLMEEADTNPPKHCQATAQQFLDSCLSRAQHLDRFIEELCCNPKMAVASGSGEADSYWQRVKASLPDSFDTRDFGPASLHWFHDILGALFEFKRRYEERARSECVETSASKTVFEALNYALDTKRSSLIEGKSGFGKTTAVKAWCDMHLGQARYVQLTGITNRTTFFRKLGKALGVAMGKGFSAGRIQTRVEDFLQRTKLMLVIDEGHYLWPQGKRIESHPELVNWLNTACYNERVPFAISATEQFTVRRQHIERQTDWSSEQSRRRIRKVFCLEALPSVDDLKAVARKLLADAGDLGENAVEYAVGYALTARGYFQTLTDAIDDARLIAKRDKRDRITFKDLKTAIQDWRAPSDKALQRVFDDKPDRPRRHQLTPEPAPGEPVEPETLTVTSDRLKDRFSGVARAPGARRGTRPELVTAADD